MRFPALQRVPRLPMWKVSKRVTVTAGVSHDDFRDGVIRTEYGEPEVRRDMGCGFATTLRGAASGAIQENPNLWSDNRSRPASRVSINSSTTRGGRIRGDMPWPVDRRLARIVRCGARSSLRKLGVPAFSAETGGLLDSDRERATVQSLSPRDSGPRVALTKSISTGEALAQTLKVTMKGCSQKPELTGWRRGSGFCRVRCVRPPACHVRRPDGSFQNAMQLVEAGPIDSGRWTPQLDLPASPAVRCGRRRVRTMPFDDAFRFQDEQSLRTHDCPRVAGNGQVDACFLTLNALTGGCDGKQQCGTSRSVSTKKGTSWKTARDRRPAH